MISLGCAKNLVDAEVMMGSLLKEGFEITNENADADALIINTCSFIDAAQEESVDTILESAEFREHANSGQALIVSGCLSQRYRKELPKLMPEVDAFMGIDQVEQVGDFVWPTLIPIRRFCLLPTLYSCRLTLYGVHNSVHHVVDRLPLHP